MIRVQTTEDCQKLQDDLNRLQEWANKWQMTFHPLKCTILRIGKNHPAYNYHMSDGEEEITLAMVTKEKDLGITVDQNLKFDIHINNITKKANMITGLLWRSFKYIDEQNFKRDVA